MWGQGRGMEGAPLHGARGAAGARPRGALSTRLRYADSTLSVVEGERFLGQFSTGRCSDSRGAMNGCDIQHCRCKCLKQYLIAQGIKE